MFNYLNFLRLSTTEMHLCHFFIHILMGSILAILVREYLLVKHNFSSKDVRRTESGQPCTPNLSSSGNCQEAAFTRNGNPFTDRDISSKNDSKQSGMDESLRHLISSVWCWGEEHIDRICRFHNLYYLPNEEQFAFLHGEGSIYVGLPRDRFDPALLDLSSVRNHNVQYFNYIDMLSAKSKNLVKDAQVIHGKSLIFRRFHPDNLMHVIHDDLLPLYHTLITMETEYPLTSGGQGPFDIHLVLMDGLNPGPFQELYESFSSHTILYRKDLHQTGRPVCFTDVIVGLSKYTTWYQYGFSEPQGPIASSVNVWNIQKFSHFLKQRLNITDSELADSETIVLLTRKFNRLILNEFELSLALAQTLHMKVITMAMETHSLVEMIQTVSGASLLIGMHGSLLSLALFLPPGAMLVELFPYAVNPDHYTPYKTLVNLPGMDIRYVAWRNANLKNTVGHKDRPWDQGGIAHLNPEKQEEILRSSEVPRHLCCRDPEWLYRIYQDTTVDIETVLGLIKDSLDDNVIQPRSTMATNAVLPHLGIQKERIFPSYVTNITCSADDSTSSTSLLVSWSPPLNLEFVSYEVVKYEVWIHEHGDDDYMAWILSKTYHSFSSVDMKPETNYYIWIRCLMDNLTGPFNFQNISCST